MAVQAVKKHSSAPIRRLRRLRGLALFILSVLCILSKAFFNLNRISFRTKTIEIHSDPLNGFREALTQAVSRLPSFISGRVNARVMMVGITALADCLGP